MKQPTKQLNNMKQRQTRYVFADTPAADKAKEDPAIALVDAEGIGRRTKTVFHLWRVLWWSMTVKFFKSLFKRNR